MFEFGHLILIIGFIFILHFNLGVARFCDGGHFCSPPKECCAQGCCYLYAPPTVPRTTPPPSDHVLNLFFINHWYFWCVVFALLLAFLCACSLWKRRRQLCNWDISLPSSQSEGDSAGSCYAPPQYSRCSSFHHAPPPYTEVTSKPDLYPILFTCNGDGVKNGASYLMVQYFRNYIVRPAAGSISAASTVDSLSSSFICTVNESNTLVPPPYSRAASPEQRNTTTSHSSIPRSASHHICFSDINCFRFNTAPFTSTTNALNNVANKHKNHNVLRLSESVNFDNINSNSSGNIFSNAVILSRSDQELKYNIINTTTTTTAAAANNSNGITNNINATNLNSENLISNLDNNVENSSINNNKSYISSNSKNNHDNINNSDNNINSTNYSPQENNLQTNSNSYNSSLGEFSIMIPANLVDNDKDMSMVLLSDGISKSCQIFHNKNIPNASFNSEESPINIDFVKKFESIRSLVNSNTGSAVSSLANINSPSSPPRATSPTAEVRELLEQINKLHNSEIDTIQSVGKTELKSLFNRNNTSIAINANLNYTNNTAGASTASKKAQRPSTLQTTKKKFLNKTTKCLYTPILNDNSKIKNFISSSTNRCNKRSWISRSAPTTPGSLLPPNRMGDNSPLLFDHDEEYEQNV